jgi:hypothetical protein
VEMGNSLRGEALRVEYENKSSESLLREMKGFSAFRSSLAYDILIQRKDKRVLEYIIKDMHKNKDKTADMRSLAYVGDQRVLPEIVNVFNNYKANGTEDENYRTSIVALAALKYDLIWPVLVELAQSRRAWEIRLAADGMQAYGKKDAIPYLEKAKARIESGDYEVWYQYDKATGKNLKVMFSVDDVDRAIKTIKDGGAVSLL